MMDTESLARLYDRFNARDMEAALAMMCEDVVWANGMEGGHELGRDHVASYWKRQWARIDPHVVPTNFTSGPDGEIIVKVQQTVHDLQGTLLSQKLVCHVFRFDNGLVKRFDIREPPSAT